MKQFWKKGKNAVRRGFTLIEVLVTVGVIGVLVAVTVPAVTSQMSAADPARVLSDLTNITTSIDAFSTNVRPSMPGDIEDLANQIAATGDMDGGTVALTPAVYGIASTKWKGPYIGRPVATGGAMTGKAFASGYQSYVQNDFVRCNSLADAACTTATPDYLTVKISPLTTVEFELVNKLIDVGETAGAATGESQKFGKFRYDNVTASSTAYYFAMPLIP
ncbi:MAG: prepilin-type N-terminal cleavage/methylation domain-containing protein [Gemmatimonadaceae bacterium]|nr:prepilin-type N-terminal cleavage/methylation domain-containing protein [Gemmatimonadaceae bacterium]